jgi:glycosyltransferase involved in cell wall biosynthesis
MKLSVIGPTWPFRGGIAHFTTLLVNRLREKHDVHFISFNSQYPAWLYPGSSDKDPSDEHSGLKAEGERLLSPLNPLSWIRAVNSIVRAQPDAVVLQWWTPFWTPMTFLVTRLLRRRMPNIRILFLIHRLIAPNSGLLDFFFTRRLLWNGDGFVVMSEEEFALLRRALPHATIRSTALPPFDGLTDGRADRAQARAGLGLGADDHVVLFFGIVRQYKGLRFLIDALAIARETDPHIKLVVAGEVWGDARIYTRQIEQLSLSEHIVLHNKYVPNAELATYFAAADIVAQPYVEAVQSGVAQVAFGFGVPVISTTVGALPETISHNETGLLVPPSDSGALAVELVRFFRDDLHDAFAANIKRDRQHVSWQPLVSLIEDLATAPRVNAGAPPPVL